MMKCNFLGRHAVALCLVLVIWKNVDALSPSKVSDTANGAADGEYTHECACPPRNLCEIGDGQIFCGDTEALCAGSVTILYFASM